MIENWNAEIPAPLKVKNIMKILNEKLMSIKKVLDGGFVKSQQLGNVNFWTRLSNDFNKLWDIMSPNDGRLKGPNLHHFKRQKYSGSWK